MKINLGYGISLPIKNNKNTSNYLLDNINTIKLLKKNFNCIQIMFSKTKLNDDDLKQIKYIIKNYKYIFVHASYQINIGANLIPSQTDLFNTGIDILINEINWAIKIKAKAIILHMGKNVKNQYDNSIVYNNMIKFIIELFDKLNNKKKYIQILLETPAGQGGEMCYNLKEFIEFITKFSKLDFYKYLGICIDTCHIFQAGYNLNNDKIIKNIHKIFVPIQNKIKLIHLNDSVYPVGSHIDRHEQIGRGYIQTNQLIKFIYPYKSIPMILETIGPYEEQIKLVKNTHIL